MTLPPTPPANAFTTITFFCAMLLLFGTFCQSSGPSANKDVTFEGRGIMQTMVHPVHRPFKMPGWPVRVDGKATRITSSPMLGEHTGQVLSDWLGLTAQAVEEMKREGAI